MAESTSSPPSTPSVTTTSLLRSLWHLTWIWAEICGSIRPAGLDSSASILIRVKRDGSWIAAPASVRVKESAEWLLLCTVLQSPEKQRSTGGGTACLPSRIEAYANPKDSPVLRCTLEFPTSLTLEDWTWRLHTCWPEKSVSELAALWRSFSSAGT